MWTDSGDNNYYYDTLNKNLCFDESTLFKHQVRSRSPCACDMSSMRSSRAIFTRSTILPAPIK